MDKSAIWCIVQCRLTPEEGRRIRRTALGLAPVIGGIVFTYGLERGCNYAEILSVDDEGTPDDVAHDLWLL